MKKLFKAIVTEQFQVVVKDCHDVLKSFANEIGAEHEAPYALMMSKTRLPLVIDLILNRMMGLMTDKGPIKAGEVLAMVFMSDRHPQAVMEAMLKLCREHRFDLITEASLVEEQRGMLKIVINELSVNVQLITKKGYTDYFRESVLKTNDAKYLLAIDTQSAAYQSLLADASLEPSLDRFLDKHVGNIENYREFNKTVGVLFNDINAFEVTSANLCGGDAEHFRIPTFH